MIFALALFLAAAPTTPSREAAVTDTAAVQLFVNDPNAAGASSGIPNVSGRTVGCGASQAIGLYNDGGTTAVVCIDSTQQSNLIIDGGQIALVTQYEHPAAPLGGIDLVYAFGFDAGTPPLVMTKDNYYGNPIPIGLFSAFTFYNTSTWQVTCSMPNGYGNTGTTSTNLATGAAFTQAGTSTSPAWATTTLATRSRALRQTPGSVSGNLNAGVALSQLQGAWRGINAGEGGFLWWTRARFNTVTADQKALFGLTSTAGIMTGTVEPSSRLNTVYFGHDSAGGAAANLGICSNDGTGSATCNTLGANFPSTQTAGAMYDFWISAKPGASTIEWYILRLDSPAQASGSIASDLPVNTVQFSWNMLLNTGATGAGANVVMDFMGVCLAYNY